MSDQNQIVRDVWARTIDAGLVGSYQLSNMQAGLGCPQVGNATPPCLPDGATPAAFKVLHARAGLTTDSGEPYPVPVSSDLYPNEGFGALPHVDWRVARAAGAALQAIDAGSTYPRGGNATAARVLPGPHAGFQAPLSYMPARDLFEALGTARLNATTRRMQCVRVPGGVVYDGIACPPGSFRLPPAEVAAGCAARNLSCAAGAGASSAQTCVCRPCYRANEVEIAPVK
jgi:hypothetical protein